MASKPLVLKRKPPTRIARKPMRGQAQLELRPRVRLATRRKRARLIGVVFALVLAVGLTFGASALSYHSRFAIQDIIVTGVQALPASEVESVFGAQVNDGIRHFLSRANIFFYPQKELRQILLEKLPLIQTISFSRDSLLAQAVTISVTERTPQYLWCSQECYFMDAEGFIFAKATNPQGFFEFRGGLVAQEDAIGQVFMRGRLEELSALLDDFSSAGFPLTGATIENERDISLRLHNGLVVKITHDVSAEQLSRNLSLVLASETLAAQSGDIEYIDLRFGNRVYYKVGTKVDSVE